MLVASALIGGFLGCVGSARAQGDGEADRPPVVLRDSLLETPAVTAGTGLAPEMKVRVTVSSRGSVSRVEVTDIEPSTELDELFEEHTREVISRWRYAPAIADGEAVEATLEWTVAYQAKSGAFVPPSLGVASPLSPDWTQSRSARIFNLSKQQKVAMLARYGEVAERNLEASRRTRFETPRFVVLTDSPQPEAARILGRNLEAVFQILDGLFAEQIPPLSEPFKVVVYVFARKDSFDALRAEMQMPSWALGFYTAPGMLAFHLEVPEQEAVQSALIHEATHAYLDRYLGRRGLEIPIWLHEGLAEYMGDSRVKDGELLTGEVLKSRWALSHLAGAYRQTTQAGAMVDRLRKAIRRGEAPTIADIFAGSRAVFSGDSAAFYYPTAWLFVHYLIHGEEDWGRQEFARFLLYVAEGYPAEEAFTGVYGKTLAEIEEPFKTYAKRF